MTAKADPDLLMEALERAIAFYDGLDRDHEPGEAELLDSLSAALASEPVAGTVRDGKCTFPDCQCISPPCPHYAHQPLSAPPAPAGREEIARIIDPVAMSATERSTLPLTPEEKTWIASALSKADAILALGATLSPQTRGVSPASYCALCDLEHQLHEDAQGFHHVVKGERAACCATPPSPGAADRAAVIACCADCPPAGYPTDKTRCTSCPSRGSANTGETGND